MKNEQNTTPSNTKIISKPRIISGITFILLSVVLTLSFISYLMNWKADQSQAGTMARSMVVGFKMTKRAKARLVVIGAGNEKRFVILPDALAKTLI